MATQGNLFGSVGKSIGSSIFDPVSPGNPTNIMSPAQRSAMTFMENGPSKQFGLPPQGVGPRAQMGFDFARSASRGSKRSVFGALKAGAKEFGLLGLAIDAALVPAMTVAGGISGAAQWGAPTGLEEDYVGGAVYGTARGAGAGVGAFAGGVVGGTIGGAIGSLLGPIGTTVGAAVGGITGNIAGEVLGGKMLNSPARTLGLGARALVRTARAVDTVQFGGNFVDSRAAYTMRQRAVSDMSGSMMNARQFLGNEAIFLHER